MRFLLLPLVLALCACGTNYESELGLRYGDFVVHYGPTASETFVDGKRVCSWWVKRGIYFDKHVRVFDENDRCISVKVN
jgi:hypothetical protein